MDVRRAVLANLAIRTSPNIMNIMKYKETYLYYNYVHLVCADFFLITHCIYGHILKCKLNVFYKDWKFSVGLWLIIFK